MRELLGRTTSAELAMWAAYYQIDPWDDMRADLRSGVVASTIANVNRRKGAKAFTPKDFMPDFKRQEKEPAVKKEHGGPQTWQEQKSMLMAFASKKDTGKKG